MGLKKVENATFVKQTSSYLLYQESLLKSETILLYSVLFIFALGVKSSSSKFCTLFIATAKTISFFAEVNYQKNIDS